MRKWDYRIYIVSNETTSFDDCYKFGNLIIKVDKIFVNNKSWYKYKLDRYKTKI